jgi:hypothetical protein
VFISFVKVVVCVFITFVKSVLFSQILVIALSILVSLAFISFVKAVVCAFIELLIQAISISVSAIISICVLAVGADGNCAFIVILACHQVYV